MQDAAAIGAQHLGISLTQRQVHKLIPPQNLICTNMRMLETALCQYMEFKQEEGMHHQIGGKEHALLNYRDGGVRFVLLDVFNPSWPKGHYCCNVGHAMIHVARPMANIAKEHIGTIVRNTHA